MVAKSSEKKQIPVVEGYFTWPPEEPRLISSRCKSCGHYFFPKTFTCYNPNCKNKEVEEALLSRRGKLWSYTVVHYPPPPPFVPADPFVPFAIGEVEFPEGLKVFGMMTGCEPEDLTMNMDVEVVAEKLYEDEEGNEVVGWKLRPV